MYLIKYDSLNVVGDWEECNSLECSDMDNVIKELYEMIFVSSKYYKNIELSEIKSIAKGEMNILSIMEIQKGLDEIKYKKEIERRVKELKEIEEKELKQKKTDEQRKENEIKEYDFYLKLKEKYEKV